MRRMTQRLKREQICKRGKYLQNQNIESHGDCHDHSPSFVTNHHYSLTTFVISNFITSGTRKCKSLQNTFIHSAALSLTHWFWTEILHLICNSTLGCLLFTEFDQKLNVTAFVP